MPLAIFLLGRKIFDLAKEKGCSIIDLRRERANRIEVESVLSKRNPCFVVINGHGGDDLVAGYENKPLLIAKTNSSLLKRKNYLCHILSVRACSWRGGGDIKTRRISVTKMILFCFILRKYRTRPTEDNLAGLFLEPSNPCRNNSFKRAYRQRVGIKSSSRIFKKYSKIANK